MSTVVISAHFSSDEAEFVSAVESLLKGMGAKISKLTSDNGIAILACQSDVEEKIEVLDVDVPVIDQTGIEAPAPTPDIVPVDSTDLTTIIATSAPAVDVASPSPTPADGVGGNVILINLSAMKSLPFTIKSDQAVSELKVNGLTVDGDLVSFTYCGLFYGKMPIEKPGNIVANLDPQYTPTTIRALAVFGPETGPTTQPIPTLFKLVDVPEGDGCSVVFGNDVADLVVKSMENNLDDSLPA